MAGELHRVAAFFQFFQTMTTGQLLVSGSLRGRQHGCKRQGYGATKQDSFVRCPLLLRHLHPYPPPPPVVASLSLQALLSMARSPPTVAAGQYYAVVQLRRSDVRRSVRSFRSDRMIGYDPSVRLDVRSNPD